jgi:DNA-binding CsgD family transcriptional regulator
MASQQSDVLEIVGLLHAGVADEDAWANGLATLCAALDLDFFLMGAMSAEVGVELLGHGLPPDIIGLLSGPLANPVDNPWLMASSLAPLRQPTSEDGFGGQRVLEASRLWNEVYVPLSVGPGNGAVLERQNGITEFSMFARVKGKVELAGAEQARIRALLPHLARAWRVKRVLARWSRETKMLSAILDRLDRAIVVTDGEGKLRYANRSAEALLAGSEHLDVTRGRLRARTTRADAALSDMIRRTALTAQGQDAAAVDAIGLDGENSRVAIVSEPLAPAHGHCIGQAAEPASILFISDSDVATRPAPAALALVYGLTAAEAKVAAIVGAGQTLAAAAQANRISLNTAKYHLKSIYEKVGVTRQSELVRRVLADVGGLAEPDTMRPR